MDENIISTHSNKQCDHEENRFKLCAPCGNKISFGGRRKSQFSITQKLADLIKKFINAQFDASNSRFPTSICVTCRHTITEWEKGDMQRPLPRMPNYEDIKLTKETRTRTTFDCNCFICLVARSKGHSKLVKGKGHVRQFNTIIDETCGLYGAASSGQVSSASRGQVSTERGNAEKKTSMNICCDCFQQIGRGVRHSCGGGPSSSSARENVLSLVEKLPEKQQN